MVVCSITALHASDCSTSWIPLTVPCIWRLLDLVSRYSDEAKRQLVVPVRVCLLLPLARGAFGLLQLSFLAGAAACPTCYCYVGWLRWWLTFVSW